jgi:hypothetical protein
MFLLTTQPFHEGTSIMLSFPIWNGAAVAQAKVRYSVPNAGSDCCSAKLQKSPEL